jgi:hypothetical protein
MKQPFMASRIVCLVVALAAIAAGARPRAAATPCEFDHVDRIVAVGDVHGAYDRFLEILQTAGLVGRNGRWSGGRAHLVQLGDVLDRGPDSRKALNLLARLERDASSAGGRVHSLIGNHEAMRMLGNFQYVTPGEYAAFATRDSEDLRKAVVDSAAPADRERLMSEMPLGMVEMIRAFGPEGQYGQRLRTLNAVVKINGILFLHGGISPATASMSCTVINDTVRRELSEDLEKTRAAPLTSLAGREDGPLWYRGLALEPDSFAPDVDKILAAAQARAIVVAHTPTHRVTVRFGGKVFLMDTGMQADYVPDGRASALEIRGGVFTAIYRDSREVVAGAPQATGSR